MNQDTVLAERLDRIEAQIAPLVQTAKAVGELRNEKGVFRLLFTGLEVMKKIGATYSAEDLQKIGDGVVRLVGCLQKMTAPEALEMLDKAADLPAKVNVNATSMVEVLP